MRTNRTRRLPAFSTQIIGSFPRPRVLLDLCNRRSEFTPERFNQIMDDLVCFCIRTQGLAGLDVVSDGQWRGSPMGEFLRRVGGFEPLRKSEHPGETRLREVVVRRMNPIGSVYRADGQFLVNNTARLTKFAIPSPFAIASRYWHADYSKSAYPTVENFMEHLIEILSAEVHALVTVGIDIVQIDDTELTRFCNQPDGPCDSEDDGCREQADLHEQLPHALATISHIADSARGMAEIHLHCCHSHCKRRAEIAVDYAPLLAQIKNCHIDRINLEFACRGPDSMKALVALPANIDVGVGVVDVRPGMVQSVEQIQDLARAAAVQVSPDRIALNPDCGFGAASGDTSTLDEAYDKLRRLTAAASGLRSQ